MFKPVTTLLLLTPVLLVSSACHMSQPQKAAEVRETPPQAVTLNQKALIASHELPDPYLTPGAVRTTDAHEICLRATSDIRKVSAKTKRAVYTAYGNLGGNHTGFCSVQGGCEIDHLISLELGGSNDPQNLFPQPYSGVRWNAHVKDRLENELHRNICNGAITPEAAQRQIATNWIQTYCAIFSTDSLCKP